MLDSTSLATFKQLYLQEYGVELTEAEVYERATNLVNLYRAVFLPSKHIKSEEAYEETA